MKNLMSFSIFESSAQSKYKLEDIEELPGYRLLLAIGYYQTSTPAMKKHMSIRLYNDELDMDDPTDNIVVYSSGYVRRNNPTYYKKYNQSVRLRLGGEETLKRWNDQFLYVYDWTLGQYKKKNIISKYTDIKKSDFENDDSVIDFMVKKNKENHSLIYSLYDSLNDSAKNKFVSRIKTTREDFEEMIKKYKIAMNIVSKWLR